METTEGERWLAESLRSTTGGWQVTARSGFWVRGHPVTMQRVDLDTELSDAFVGSQAANSRQEISLVFCSQVSRPSGA